MPKPIIDKAATTPDFDFAFQTLQDEIDAADALRRIALGGSAWMLVTGENSLEIARHGEFIICTVCDERGRSEQRFSREFALRMTR